MKTYFLLTSCPSQLSTALFTRSSNRWRLQKVDFGNWSLNFRDDLCEANAAILHECEILKERGVLSKVFTYNGFVKVAVGNGRPIKVCHKNDLANIIGGYENVHDNPTFI